MIFFSSFPLSFLAFYVYEVISKTSDSQHSKNRMISVSVGELCYGQAIQSISTLLSSSSYQYKTIRRNSCLNRSGSLASIRHHVLWLVVIEFFCTMSLLLGNIKEYIQFLFVYSHKCIRELLLLDVITSSYIVIFFFIIISCMRVCECVCCAMCMSNSYFITFFFLHC